MTKKFVDCFMLMGTALSLRGGQKLPEMGRPLLQDVITTTVNLSLLVQELTVSDHYNLEVELSGLLDQKWVDPRLGANFKTRKMAVAGQIWKPKIVNINGKNRNYNNDDTVFWRGFGDEGNVLLSEKINLKSTCTRSYQKFPFDTQICDFKFGTFRFPLDEVSLVWDFIPVQVTTDLNYDEFNVTNVVTYLQTDIRCSGNFSIAVVQFTLKRHPQRYIKCIILPSLVLTLLNYVSFWFNLNKRSTRLYLNFLIFGFMVYLYYVSVCLLHPTPYLKVIDIFVLICKLFAMITLLETIFIDVMCGAEELQFHLKKLACSKEYPRCVFWAEFAMKLSYPIFYVFFVTIFCWMYF